MRDRAIRVTAEAARKNVRNKNPDVISSRRTDTIAPKSELGLLDRTYTTLLDLPLLFTETTIKE